MQSDSKKPESEVVGWYALKVFYNRTERVREEISGLAKEIYAPRNVISSLMFVRTTPAKLEYIRKDHYKHLKVYSQPGERTPYVIPDREMAAFRLVADHFHEGMLILQDEAYTRFREGGRVRVKEGPFKGAEGYIKRIRKDRRLLVAIEGVIAVATSYIPPENLEPVPEPEA